MADLNKDDKSNDTDDAAVVTFIAGTGTEIGKTYYAVKLIETLQSAGRRVGVYKPVASGVELDASGRKFWNDPKLLHGAVSEKTTINRVCPQTFEAALAPPAAAAAEGRQVDENLMLDGFEYWLNKSINELVVETAGGLFSPISQSWLVIDAIEEMLARSSAWRCELHIVALNQLGVIHDVNATLRALQSHPLQTKLNSIVVVLNDRQRQEISQATNQRDIQTWNVGLKVVSIT
ncbi:MAG: dethiobiotin synthase [Planctomycetota bacterium]